MKKHLFLIFAVVVVGVAVLLGAVKLLSGGADRPGGGAPGGFAAGGGGRPGGFGGGGPRGVSVTPATVEVRSFSDRVEVLGVAKAHQSITLTAAASQLVTKINFQSGQYVRRGQVLAELNAREQDAAIMQARSQVAFAKSTWERWQSLADRGIAPAITAEQYKAQYEQALATLQANEARAGDRVVRAPFSGVIGLTDAAPGMLLSPGAAIATLDDLSTIRVDFPVPERYISLLKDGLPITATADAYPGTTFRGRIARLDTRLDPTTRAMTARAEFPNPDSRLKPGMLMRVAIDQASRQNPAVPESAVVFEGGEAYVFEISASASPRGAGVPPGAGQGRPGGAPPGAAPQAGARQGGAPGGAAPQGGAPRAGGGQGRPGGGQGGPALTAVRTTIQTGVRRDGWVEVLSGLSAGDRVVADGTNRVRPNDTVTIAGPGQGQAGPTAGGRESAQARAPASAG